MLTMSPGTSSSIGNSTSSPSRRTLALTTIIFWSAATLAEALPSWLRPIAALSRVRPIRTTPVGTWPGMNRLTMPATEQHDLHRIAVLAQERLPARLLRRLGELVGAEAAAAGFGLGAGQAGFDLDGLLAKRLVRASACHATSVDVPRYAVSHVSPRSPADRAGARSAGAPRLDAGRRRLVRARPP